MPRFTVIVPTHDHADTLYASVQSVLTQSLGDFELFIVGDGVPPRTRQIAEELCARDTRIRYFDFPKGERLGERHRHVALQDARGEYVAYHADDDLWFPDHLETLQELLADADLAHTMQIEIWPDGRTASHLFNASVSADRIKLAHGRSGFGLNVGGHRLEAYRRLPEGWRTTPVGRPTDFYMWLQFLEQPWCRYCALPWPTALHFSSVVRAGVAVEQRRAELEHWVLRLTDPLQQSRLRRKVLSPIATAIYRSAMTRDALVGALAARILPPCRPEDQLLPELLPMNAGVRLRFAAGEISTQLLIGGFSEPEEWGVWTEGEQAQLAVPVPSDIDGMPVLHLRLAAYVRAQHPVCEVRICVEGEAEYALRITEVELVVAIPLTKKADKVILVRFEMDNPISPFALGESSDTRRLGIGLRELYFDGGA